MAKQLLGKNVSAALNEKIKTKVLKLSQRGIVPTLAFIRVGERPDDVSYEKSAIKRCEKLGITYKKYELPGDCTDRLLLETIAEVNEDKNIHGVLMFRPLPGHMDEEAAIMALDSEKDVDGVTQSSILGVFAGKTLGFPPCTAKACIELLDYYGIECTGKKAVVIGRSLVVGKPVSMMLLDKNATVTICHTKTEDMPSIVRGADIVIAAAGKAGIIGADCLREGQVVIDVGINVDEDGKLCGDVNYEEANAIVGMLTPVPGGVGGVTTLVLADHVAKAAMRQNGFL